MVLSATGPAGRLAPPCAKNRIPTRQGGLDTTLLIGQTPHNRIWGDRALDSRAGAAQDSLVGAATRREWQRVRLRGVHWWEGTTFSPERQRENPRAEASRIEKEDPLSKLLEEG